MYALKKSSNDFAYFLNFMNFILFAIKFMKSKPVIKFIKFERHNSGLLALVAVTPKVHW